MRKAVLGRLIGSGKAAEVFAFGSAALKLYRPSAPKRSAFREAAALALVESFGLPVPQVLGVQQIEGRWGVIMTVAPGPSFGDAVRHRPDPALRQMAVLQRRVHNHTAPQLPSLKLRLETNIRQVHRLEARHRDALLARLAGMPDGDRLCHGDFHPLNISGPPGHEILLDWLDAACGPPAADVCRSYVLMHRVDPEIAAAYVNAYAEVSGESVQRIQSWLPFVAAARMAEGVPDEEETLLSLALG